MEHSSFIANIVLLMRGYQEAKNIKKQCVTNIQYLYDFIKLNNICNVKTKAVYVFSYNDEENIATIVSGHLVIELDNKRIIEPSYDIFCLKNKYYFDNIKDLKNMYDDKTEYLKNNMKQIINDHLHFMKLSEQINNGGLLMTDKEHYDNQANYVEKYMSKINKLFI